ncbi:hypothetical protein E2C01_076101 [Portunus trituberculatus]|uniref:Uncharacterized protein n=1 Tax=Portunus trituberculatus TaxID=210409 RepID=A0A5B7IMS6_PORTR|nr:hypothetical protein [Portunus trituberculatus]
MYSSLAPLLRPSSHGNPAMYSFSPFTLHLDPHKLLTTFQHLPCLLSLAPPNELDEELVLHHRASLRLTI